MFAVMPLETAVGCNGSAAEHPDFSRDIRNWANQAQKLQGIEPLRERDRYNPQTIGPYRVIQSLGNGGFGSVFLGRRSENERPVAIKVLLHKASEARAGIEQEISLLAELDHPTIVDVYEFGESEDGHFYYTMDFIPGRVLDSFFNRDRFSNEDLLTTFLQICDSLGVTLYLILTGQFLIAPEDILRALGVGRQAAYDTLMTTQVAPLTETLAAVTEVKEEGKKRYRAGYRVMSQLNNRQRKRVNEIVLNCLEKNPEGRIDDTLVLGEKFAWVFGLGNTPLGRPWRIGQWLKNAANRWIPTRDPEKKYSENNRSQVWFVTDRSPDQEDQDHLTFGSKESDELTFGCSTIGLPKWRALGRLRPQWWERLWGNRRYSVIKHVKFERQEFANSLSEAADTLGVLLFIHGYNSSFDQAVVRAAQLQSDLKMNGRVICYSWPSLARVYGYGADAAIVEQSEKHVMETIKLITGLSPSPFVHVMAHSMGNRALLRGISRLAESQDRFLLSHVILAAPDVGQGLFKELCGVYIKRGKRCTLYASKHDRALMGSRFIHARGRAGYIPPIMVIDGIDTVDSSRIGFRLWGLNHSGFGDCREIITDIAALIRQDLPPEHRIGLERQIDPECGKAYWVCIQ